MKFTYVLICFLVALPVIAQKRSSEAPRTIYTQSKGSVVTILTFGSKNEPLSQGSGFIVSKNLIVTNYHVLAGSTTASVVFNDGTIVVSKAVVAASQPKDLAILDVDTGNKIPLTMGSELQLKVGESVYAIGAPNGLPASLSDGLVSAFRQDEGQFLIQITAPIAPGSSGGPLFNHQGQVVGITTSRLKDGGFGFAVGANDIEQLLLVTLTVPLALTDLPQDFSSEGTSNELKTVQDLYEQKKYNEAFASFHKLAIRTQIGFDGQLILCKIEKKLNEYNAANEACDTAIRLNPDSADAYTEKSATLYALGDLESAETMEVKATQLSNDIHYLNFLGQIYYAEEKYSLIRNQINADSKDPFVLSLLAGAYLHNGDYDSFKQITSKITEIKGPNNAWQLYIDGLTALKNLDYVTATDKFHKCAEDEDFLDPSCLIALANIEATNSDYASAQSDIEAAMKRYPRNHEAITEAIFISLLQGKIQDAGQIHNQLALLTHEPQDDSTECLYYYGSNKASAATEYCNNYKSKNETNYAAWLNAGYVELDNAQYSQAYLDFSKAKTLFNNSKDKHAKVEDLNLSWGIILSTYYSGDQKQAKKLFKEVKKLYPESKTIKTLKEQPLVWSDNTQSLAMKVITDFR